MKICENCYNSHAICQPDRSQPSQLVITKKGNENGFTWLFPTIEGTLCSYCQKKLSGRFDSEPEMFRHGHLVNHHEDNNNKLRKENY